MLWGLLDEGATLISTYEGENSKGIEFGKKTKDMRRLYATLSKTFDKIDSSVMRASEKKYQFHCALEDLKVRTGRTAMLYGLSILPDEILAQIFVHASDDLKATMAISRVCKHFRSVVMSVRDIWSDIWLSSFQSTEKILTIAEGQRFRSLKAYIDERESTLGMSTKAILSLGQHLVNLEITLFRNVEAFTSLGRIDLPALHRLTIESPSSYDPSCLLKCLIMPSLKELSADFVPPPSFARNLVKCSLSLPRIIMFVGFLEFCSSFEVLRELTVLAWDVNHVDDAGIARYLHPITLSSITHLSISARDTLHNTLTSLMISKMHFPSLELFSLSCDIIGTNTKRYLGLMLHSPRIERFCLESKCVDLADVFGPTNSLFKVFELSAQYVTLNRPLDARASRWRLLEGIIFHDCTPSRGFIRRFREFLQSTGHASNTVSIEFRECFDVCNGSYTIDSMESAFPEG
ncbi:hypothetical protein ACEPAI_8485 [Sanghuangporus weigelae]